MTDFITRQLAEILEWFKLKNPKVYAVVVMLLMVAVYFAEQGTLYGIFTLSPLVADIVKWASIALTALFSSQTFPFLSPTSQANRAPLPPK